MSSRCAMTNCSIEDRSTKLNSGKCEQTSVTERCIFCLFLEDLSPVVRNKHWGQTHLRSSWLLQLSQDNARGNKFAARCDISDMHGARTRSALSLTGEYGEMVDGSPQHRTRLTETIEQPMTNPEVRRDHSAASTTTLGFRPDGQHY